MSGVRTVVEGFHRTDAEGDSVSFGADIRDPEALEKYLRSEQGVYGQYGADQLVILMDPDGDLPGTCAATVALVNDNDHYLRTIERGIRYLEAVRDGLRETGHHDWEPRKIVDTSTV